MHKKYIIHNYDIKLVAYLIYFLHHARSTFRTEINELENVWYFAFHKKVFEMIFPIQAISTKRSVRKQLDKIVAISFLYNSSQMLVFLIVFIIIHLNFIFVTLQLIFV